MGTTYMSDVPFASEPALLDLDEVGYFANGILVRPRAKYPKYKLTEDLFALRNQYIVGVGRWGESVDIVLHRGACRAGQRRVQHHGAASGPAVESADGDCQLRNTSVHGRVRVVWGV